MKTAKQINKSIMHRVYYAFAIRVATHTVTLHALALVVLGYALSKLVFVAKVYDNLASRDVSEVLPALTRILLQADVLTLAVFGLAVFTALSLPLKTLMPQKAQLQFA